MAGHEEDLYGTQGSVPNQVEVNGTGARELSVRANPDAFGASVGQAITGAGEKVQETAAKFQGMMNETLATNADAALAEKIGAIKGKYKSLTGLEAVNAQQDTIDQLNKAFQETRAGLPPMAAQGFDSMAKRSLGYSLGEINEYGASQIKSANTLSHGQAAMMAAFQAKDPAVANNDEEFGHKLGTIKWSAASMIDPDHPGLNKDPDTGMISGFKDNDDGQNLKSLHQNTVDAYTSLAYKNKYDTLGAQDAISAEQKFDAEKFKIPPVAAADIDSTLRPLATYQKASQSSAFTIVKAQQDHAAILTNPSSMGPNPYNLGNVKTASGAANGTAEFVNPASPTDGVILTANNLIKNYQGMTLSEIAQKWTGEPDKADAWIKNASAASGIDPNSQIDLKNAGQLSSLMKGIAAAEKSPKDAAQFTDDVISSGVQSALSGQEAKTVEGKSYATNPDGSKFTDADYLSTHKEQLLEQAVSNAEERWPGDAAAATKARELMNQHIENVVQTQAANFRKDNLDIMKAVAGDMTKGVPPVSENELRKIPGMDEILKRVPAQDPKFYEQLPTLISKAQRSNDKVNSPNAYENLRRTLEPNDNDYPNRIASQDHLDKILGRSDGTGINMKDYNDIKPALEMPDNYKKVFSDAIKQVEGANGNVDGKGQDRAVMWYNQAMKLMQANDAKGDKKIPDIELIKNIQSTVSGYQPSRIQQLGQLSRNTGQQTAQNIAVITSPDSPEFQALKSGESFQTPDGRTLVKK